MNRRPLGGRTVVLTRAREQARPLVARLEDLGARVVTVPAIRFRVSDDLRQWRAALDNRGSFTHLVFTSQMAARFFVELTRASAMTVGDWAGCRVLAIGKATAAALREQGLEVDFVSRARRGIEFAAEVVEAEGLGPGHRILLPRSALARPEVADPLEAAGVTVEPVPIYETVPEDPREMAPLVEILDEGGAIDALVFASPSAARFFFDMAGELGRRVLGGGARVVAIGPSTADALRLLGIEDVLEARSPDIDRLVEAVLDALRRPGDATSAPQGS